MRFNTRMLLSYVLMPSCAAAALLAPLAVNARQAPTKKDVQALYDRFADTIKRKDIKALGDLMAPNMVNVGKNGKSIPRDASLKTMQQAFNEITKVQTSTFTVGQPSSQDNKFTVNATYHMVGVLADPQGRTHTLDTTAVTHATWTKTGGKWQMSRLEDQPGGKVLVDGKLTPAPSGG